MEGIDKYKDFSKSKRRELVNKYPFVVLRYCAERLELNLKAVVVPIYGASCYVAVSERNPMGLWCVCITYSGRGEHPDLICTHKM